MWAKPQLGVAKNEYNQLEFTLDNAKFIQFLLFTCGAELNDFISLFLIVLIKTSAVLSSSFSTRLRLETIK